MKKISLLVAMLALLVSLAAVSARADELIDNGGFEAPVQGGGSWNIYTSLPGWTGGQNGIELRNNVAGTAYEGWNFVELDTTANSCMYQDVDTLLGQEYLLSFYYAPRKDVAYESNGIELKFNGDWLLSASGDNNTDPDWKEYHYTVFGTGGKDRVLFTALGVSDSYGGSIDKVSMSSVPLPGALLLFGSGLLGLVGVRRKIKS
jgi:hypothetical protein